MILYKWRTTSWFQVFVMQVFCKQTTTKIVWYVRCNQCFTVYFIYRSGNLIIDETHESCKTYEKTYVFRLIANIILTRS